MVRGLSGDKVREVQRKMTENVNGCSKGGECWCEDVRDSVRWSTVAIPKGSRQKKKTHASFVQCLIFAKS